MLLQALAEQCGPRVQQAILDARLLQVADVPFIDITSLWVRNTLASRLTAEWKLWRNAKVGDTVLCLHSLPPLMPLRARTVVLVQNRLLLEVGPLSQYPRGTRMRITVERLWARYLQGRVKLYVVQTPSMADTLAQWLRRHVPTTVVPFAPHQPMPTCDDKPEKQFDFIYPASGEAHKNHLRLLQAWQMLASSGIQPRLALTVDAQRYPELTTYLAQQISLQGLAIRNLGELQPSQVNALYSQAGALIFPSLLEAFGLPLIEAKQHGLPILASELDYVRDLTQPVQTFDPHSALSIARAVRRHMGVPEPIVQVMDGSYLLDEVLR